MIAQQHLMLLLEKIRVKFCAEKTSTVARVVARLLISQWLEASLRVFESIKLLANVCVFELN